MDERNTKMNVKVQEFFDKTEGKIFDSFEDMINFGRENAKVYKCHAPHLIETLEPAVLRPELKLVNLDECPNKEMHGECHKCEYMVNVLSEDSTIFAFGTYDLVCAY